MIVNSEKNKKTAETAGKLCFTDVAPQSAETLEYLECVLERLVPKPLPDSYGKQRKDREKPAKREEKKKDVCVINGYVA